MAVQIETSSACLSNHQLDEQEKQQIHSSWRRRGRQIHDKDCISAAMRNEQHVSSGRDRLVGPPMTSSIETTTRARKQGDRMRPTRRTTTRQPRGAVEMMAPTIDVLIKMISTITIIYFVIGQQQQQKSSCFFANAQQSTPNPNSSKFFIAEQQHQNSQIKDGKLINLIDNNSTATATTTTAFNDGQRRQSSGTATTSQVETTLLAGQGEASGAPTTTTMPDYLRRFSPTRMAATTIATTLDGLRNDPDRRQQQRLELPLEVQLKLKPLALPQPPPIGSGGGVVLKRRRSLENGNVELNSDSNQVPIMQTNHLLSDHYQAAANNNNNAKSSNQLNAIRRTSWQEAARRVLLISSIESQLIQAARLDRRMLNPNGVGKNNKAGLEMATTTTTTMPTTTTTTTRRATTSAMDGGQHESESRAKQAALLSLNRSARTDLAKQRPTNLNGDETLQADNNGTTTEIRRQRHSAQQPTTTMQPIEASIELVKARDPLEEGRIQALAAAMLPFVWPSFQLTNRSIQGNKLRIRSLDSSKNTNSQLSSSGGGNQQLKQHQGDNHWPNIEYRQLSRQERVVQQGDGRAQPPTTESTPRGGETTTSGASLGPTAASEQAPSFVSLEAYSLSQPTTVERRTTTTTTTTSTAKPTAANEIRNNPSQQQQVKKKRRKSNYLLQNGNQIGRRQAAGSTSSLSSKQQNSILPDNEASSPNYQRDSTRLASKYQMPKIKFQSTGLSSNGTATIGKSGAGGQLHSSSLNNTTTTVMNSPSQMPSSLSRLIEQQLRLTNNSNSTPLRLNSNSSSQNVRSLLNSNELTKQLIKSVKMAPTTSVSKVFRLNQQMPTNNGDGNNNSSAFARSVEQKSIISISVNTRTFPLDIERTHPRKEQQQQRTTTKRPNQSVHQQQQQQATSTTETSSLRHSLLAPTTPTSATAAIASTRNGIASAPDSHSQQPQTTTQQPVTTTSSTATTTSASRSKVQPVLEINHLDSSVGLNKILPDVEDSADAGLLLVANQADSETMNGQLESSSNNRNSTTAASLLQAQPQTTTTTAATTTTTTTTTTKKPKRQPSSHLDQNQDAAKSNGTTTRRSKQQRQQKQTSSPLSNNHIKQSNHIKLFHFKRKPDMAKLPFYRKPLNYTELGWSNEQIQEHLMEIAKFELQQQREAGKESPAPTGADEEDSREEERDAQDGDQAASLGRNGKRTAEQKFIETTSRLAEQTDNELLLLKRKRRAKSQFDRLMAELQAAAVASAAAVAQQQQQQKQSTPSGDSNNNVRSSADESSVIPVLRKKHEPLIMKPMFFVMNQKRRHQNQPQLQASPMNGSSPAAATTNITPSSLTGLSAAIDPLASSGSRANVSIADLNEPPGDSPTIVSKMPQVRIRRKHHGEQPLQLFSAISSLQRDDQWRPARPPTIWPQPPQPHLNQQVSANNNRLMLVPSGLLTPSGSHLMPFYQQQHHQSAARRDVVADRPVLPPSMSSSNNNNNWLSSSPSSQLNTAAPIPEQIDTYLTLNSSPQTSLSDLQSTTSQVVATSNDDTKQQQQTAMGEQMAPQPAASQSSSNKQQQSRQPATTTTGGGELRVPKLLVKPMRPAKYSLNGYIPKPSLNQSPAPPANVNNGQSAAFSLNQQQAATTTSLLSSANNNRNSMLLPKSSAISSSNNNSNNRSPMAGKLPFLAQNHHQPQQPVMLFGKDLDSSTSNEIFSRRRGLQQHQRSIKPKAALIFDSLLTQPQISIPSSASPSMLPIIEKRQSSAQTVSKSHNRTLNANYNELLSAADALADDGDDGEQVAARQQQLKRKQQLEENRRKYIQQHQQSFAKSAAPLSLQKVNQIRAKLGLPQQQQQLHSLGGADLSKQASTNKISTLDPPQSLIKTNNNDDEEETSASSSNNDLKTSNSIRKAASLGGAPLNSIPKTDFECTDKKGRFVSGLFADYKTGCQVWHLCSNNRKYSFLCPAGTIFNAKVRICDWRYNVKCENTLPS